jgi:hypothetical protein
MKIFNKIIVVSSLFILTVGLFSGCKNNDPSVMKIFVRSASNQLLSGAKVVIIGDVNSNPATLAYVDTVQTTTSGFALFDLSDYFNAAGKSNSIGYFDVLVQKNGQVGSGYVRCRSNITTVETIYIN